MLTLFLLFVVGPSAKTSPNPKQAEELRKRELVSGMIQPARQFPGGAAYLEFKLF
jgi:hypothetical protein